LLKGSVIGISLPESYLDRYWRDDCQGTDGGELENRPRPIGLSCVRRRQGEKAASRRLGKSGGQIKEQAATRIDATGDPQKRQPYAGPTREGYHKDDPQKNLSCDRSGCYAMAFTPPPRSPLQKFCLPSCQLGFYVPS